MRLEGKALVREPFMRQVEAVPGEEMPILLLAQFTNGKSIAYYAEAMSPEVQQEIAPIVRQLQFPDVEAVLNVLRTRNLRFEVGHYRTYLFPSGPGTEGDVIVGSKQNPGVKAFGFDRFAENIYTIEREGRVVSACVSARENEQCGEAWVYTDAAYRNQGFAQKVVKAWARDLIEKGKVPFYSHARANVASASLARKLGLQFIFEEIAITQI